jgi:hypothetical protein
MSRTPPDETTLAPQVVKWLIVQPPRSIVSLVEPEQVVPNPADVIVISSASSCHKAIPQHNQPVVVVCPCPEST